MTKNTPSAPKPISHTKDILLLFSIPLGIAALALLVMYVPSLFARPSYSFIYAYCTSYDCGDSYSVDASGQLTQQITQDPGFSAVFTHTSLAYYDATNGSSTILSYDEAKAYHLINSSKSPDGYTLTHNTSDSGFLFWGNSQDNWQLEKGIQHKTVHLNGTDNTFGSNVTFLAWVQK